MEIYVTQQYEIIEMAFKSGEISQEAAIEQLQKIGCELANVIVDGWIEDLEIADQNAR
jgi:hypothetical protein